MITRLLTFLTCLLIPLLGEANDSIPPHRRAKIAVAPSGIGKDSTTLYQTLPPRWIASLSLPLLPKVGQEDVQMLLVEKQIHVDNETTYYRVAKRVLTDAGIHNHSLVALTYDPSFQKITLHNLCLHRRGTKIDRSSSSNFHLVQSDERDGDPSRARHWSLVTVLDDVREGDVIEYSYSTQGHNPSFMEHTVDECAFQYPYPVERIYYRVTGATPCRVKLMAHHTDLQPERHQLDKDQWEWVWNATHVPAYVAEANQPSWYQMASWVQISEFQDWNDVACWGTGLFHTPKRVPAKMGTLVTDWEQQHLTETARALAALRYVQDEIKPVFEKTSEIHYPRDLSLVMNRNKGDSIDKAYLFKVLLDMMGISATPAAVSTHNRHAVADWLPSPSAFDKVIVRVKADGVYHWVDPSQPCTGGGLTSNSSGLYKRALLFDPAMHELTCLGYSLDKPQIITDTTYYLWPDRLDSTILVTTTLNGSAADLFRRRLKDYGYQAVVDGLRTPYVKLHGDVATALPAQIEDDRDRNSIVISEHYRIKNLWDITHQGQTKALTVHPLIINTQLPLIDYEKRKTPLALNYPTHVVETIHLIAPGHLWPKSQEGSLFQGAVIEGNVVKETSGDTMTLSGELKILKDHVAADELVEHLDLTDDLLQATTVSVELPTQHRRTGDVTAPFIISLYLAMAIAFLAVGRK